MATVGCGGLKIINMKALNIFIVDDDQDFAKSMANLMIANGHKVELAFSGEEAISKFTEHDFDITFMDVRLPRINGVESFFEIRKIKPDAKVVMMTAFTVEQLLQQATDNGAMATLHKPFDNNEVKDVLKHISQAGIILIADDDKEFVQSIENILELEGFRTLVASTGNETVEKVLANNVDILILDLRLPVMSGLEVYLELKKLSRTLPTLIVTGYKEEEKASIDRLNQLSVSGCLLKPFEMKELLQSIDELINYE